MEDLIAHIVGSANGTTTVSQTQATECVQMALAKWARLQFDGSNEQLTLAAAEIYHSMKEATERNLAGSEYLPVVAAMEGARAADLHGVCQESECFVCKKPTTTVPCRGCDHQTHHECLITRAQKRDAALLTQKASPLTDAEWVVCPNCEGKLECQADVVLTFKHEMQRATLTEGAARQEALALRHQQSQNVAAELRAGTSDPEADESRSRLNDAIYGSTQRVATAAVSDARAALREAGPGRGAPTQARKGPGRPE